MTSWQYSSLIKLFEVSPCCLRIIGLKSCHFEINHLKQGSTFHSKEWKMIRTWFWDMKLKIMTSFILNAIVLIEITCQLSEQIKKWIVLIQEEYNLYGRAIICVSIHNFHSIIIIFFFLVKIFEALVNLWGFKSFPFGMLIIACWFLSCNFSWLNTARFLTFDNFAWNLLQQAFYPLHQIFIFFGHAKFLGQGSNPSHRSDLSCCSDNTGSLTHCTTRELPQIFIFCKI